MKKVFLFAAAMMMAVTVSAGKKLIVSVGDFESATSVDLDVEDKVKSNVISGLSNVGHLQMIEAKDGLGADYLVTGNVLSYNVTKSVDDDGKTWYKTTMSYSITATNVKDGTTETETFKYDGTGSNFLTSLADVKYGYSQDPNASKEKVFTYIAKDMKIFAFEHFPLQGQIVEADYKLDKKNKLTECYITLGSEDGVEEKTKFEVRLGRMVAGRKTTSKADVTLKVVEVVAGDLARCKVTGKDADKVAAALEAYASDPQNALPVYVKILPPKDTLGW